MQYLMVVLGILIFIFCFPGVIRTRHLQPEFNNMNLFNQWNVPFNSAKGNSFPIFNANKEDFSVYEFHSPGGNGKKDKLQHLGDTLKSQVEELRRTPNHQLELVFLVDSSSSVGFDDFQNELKFVKKLLADFTVDAYNTRVAVVTFSSESRVIRHINQLETNDGRKEHHKCSLLQEDMPKINYAGGGTYTLGAFLETKVC